VLLATWLVVALPTAAVLFLTGSRTTVVAGHDAVVRPSLDGFATLDLGPYLPNFRYPIGGTVGARIDLGKTTADSYSALIQRYAFLASRPEGQIRKVALALNDLAVDSAVDGALVGLLAPAVVLLVGRRRWAEVRRGVTVRRTTVLLVVVLAAGTLAARPWDRNDEPVEVATWQPLSDAIPDVPLPNEALPLQVESGLVTTGTRRLVESVVDSYRRSTEFYGRLVDAAADLSPQLHRPADGETVGLLVSDRHDNIGMDPVARAIADQGQATFLLDAGDDTSTGGSWEAFSLESLDDAFDDYDERVSIAGNHDNGDFVSRQARTLGFTTLEGKVVDGPAGIRLLGVSDPRSSGLGTWRDERGISFEDQEQRLADLACRHDADGDRITTLLVHDASSGRQALDDGCVDLVLAGHLHEQVGPTATTGANGKVGYSYTNGTTGGAAFALAIGSKLKRDAEVTLVTYAAGVPVGLQPVMITTIGEFRVGDYLPLRPTGPTPSPVTSPTGRAVGSPSP
jgi:predicted phosphodiesterase